MDITKQVKLGVVGVGKVGMSIAQAFAQAGFAVLGVDVSRETIDRGLTGVGRNLDRLVEKGKMAAEERNAVLTRMEMSTDFSALAHAQVVIEAVFENMELKKETFRRLDALVSAKDALLLTNTSSLSVTEIASVTARPERVAGMHFFNPVPIMKLVEVVKGTLTSDRTVSEVAALARLMGKTPIVSTDSPGFIVNRMLNALTAEAARIVEEGVSSVEDVDTGARLGLGHPMGPFQLFDYLNAIHLLDHVCDYMSGELGSHFRLPVWVKNLVRAGKTKGFHEFGPRG